MGLKTLHVIQEAHANAMATNKDATQVAIAGRNIFKVFNIEDDEIVERINLRVGKNINLNYSTGDVVWSHHDDMMLATAATNGSVVLWRLDKSSLSKQDMVFHDHRRTVHKVTFHPFESHLLLSGSQDGTMKLFDLRKKAVVTTFYSNSESVRDIEFSPFIPTTFAAAQENGHLQIWDLRKPDRCEKSMTAHRGPVFACNWHPEERNWLASGGRDRVIKVWDVESWKEEHTIITFASVTHVKWRPQRKFHIASTSLVMDFSVNVWDLRRPYIPFVLFNEHKDVTTAIAWRTDPGVLLSTSKDNTLYQHAMADGVRPIEKSNPAGLDINFNGDVCMAMTKKVLCDISPMGKETLTVAKIPAFFRRGPSICEEVFCPIMSSLSVASNVNEKHLSNNWFLESAMKYQLNGHSISEICEHNAGIASDLKRIQEATSWNVLKYLYPTNLFINEVKPSSSSELEKVPDSIHYFDTPSIDQRSNRHQIVSNHRHHSLGGKVEDRQFGETSTGFSEEETETDDTDYEWTLTNIASGVAYSQDFYIGGDDEGLGHPGFSGFDIENDRVVNLESKMAMINWQLPMEAFEPRIDLTDPSPIPDHLLEFYRQGDEDQDQMVSVMSSKVNESSTRSDDDDVHSLSVDNSYQNVPEWDFNPVVVEMLNFYASQGDMQMAVSVLIVLGEHIKSYIDTAIQEEWYQVYIDLLERLKLFTVANQVIKLSPLPSISSMNQQSTSLHTNCSCGHPLGRLEWFCDRCKSASNVCTVCHRLVKGLYVWCQGCSHGGHMEHWQSWLGKKSHWCPAGCGHWCEFV